jgi:hypothetical protein
MFKKNLHFGKADDFTFCGIGKHNDVPDSQFNPKELALGIKTELEHTNNIGIAKKIAKDHLQEFRDYYTRLQKAGL